MSNLSRTFIAIILSFAFSINYLDEIQPIFNASCISCHNSDSHNYSNHQLDLTSYSGLMNGGESGYVITPYDASSSILYQEIDSGNMPQYGSGEFLLAEQINLIADWINDGALEEEDSSGDPENWDCLDDSSCMDGEFCAIECFTGECGLDGSESSGTLGQYCQPCDECQAPEDAVSGNCDSCGTSNDGGDDGGDDDGPPECWADCSGFDTLYEGMNGGVFCDFYVDAYNGDCLDDCSDEDGPDELLYSFCDGCLNDESMDCDDIFGEDCVDLDYSDCEDDSACEWNDYEQTCEDVDDDGDDGAPECMLDCEGIATVDPDDDANAFCEWFIPTYDDSSCMNDCEYDYGLMVDQIYYMCQLCLVDNSCDEMWNSEDCSDLDEYECETSEDCEWNDYDANCEEIEMNCADMGECECEFNFDCQWNDYDMSCEDNTDDGPPECWQDCEAAETLEDASGTEICNWLVPIFEDGICFEDCHDCGPEEMIYDICQMCMQDDSCDDYFQDDESCSDFDEYECEMNEDCLWDDYDMICEEYTDDNELEGECLDSNDCDDGLFCNMDHTSDEEVTAGSCEPCDYYSAIEDCYTDGLPEAGEAECADVCFDDGGALDNDLTIQDTYRISSVYPNPFNPTTTVTYQIPEFSTISIDIYNMNGQLVENLYRGYKSPGEYSIEWNAGNITSGAYLVKLVSGSFVETQKVMLVK